MDLIENDNNEPNTQDIYSDTSSEDDFDYHLGFVGGCFTNSKQLLNNPYRYFSYYDYYEIRKP